MSVEKIAECTNYLHNTATMASITSVVKTSELILKSPLLSKIVVPLAKTYVKFSGYRQLGFK